MFPVPDAAVWDSLKGGAVTKMPLKERLAYVRFYNDVANLRSLYYPLRDEAVTLNSYMAWDAMSPAEAHNFMREVQRGRNLLGVMVGNAPFELASARAAGAEPRAFTPETRENLAIECASGGVALEDKGG
jgi:hypothetical protein